MASFGQRQKHPERLEWGRKPPTRSVRVKRQIFDPRRPNLTIRYRPQCVRGKSFPKFADAQLLPIMLRPVLAQQPSFRRIQLASVGAQFCAHQQFRHIIDDG